MQTFVAGGGTIAAVWSNANPNALDGQNNLTVPFSAACAERRNSGLRSNTYAAQPRFVQRNA
jgi:hypothetical protein